MSIEDTRTVLCILALCAAGTLTGCSSSGDTVIDKAEKAEDEIHEARDAMKDVYDGIPK